MAIEFTSFTCEEGAVEVTSVDVTCGEKNDDGNDDEDDNFCGQGDQLIASGAFSVVSDNLPEQDELYVRFCALDFYFFQLACYELYRETVDICDFGGLSLEGDNGAECPAQGDYSFSLEQTLKGDVWDKIPEIDIMSGLPVKIWADYGDSIECKATFAYRTEGDDDDGDSSYVAGALVVVVGGALVWMRKRHLRASRSNDDEANATNRNHGGVLSSNFVEMTDKGALV